MRREDAAQGFPAPSAMAEEALSMNAALHYIGHIRTPYQTLGECPRNVDPGGPLCELCLDEAFEQGLDGLAPGAGILVLYWLDQADRRALVQRRRKSGQLTGVFALRSPHRPNPIGAAVVTVVDISGNRVRVRGLDCLDGTPLLDIKPAL
jgi:tRNA-Thr(GGU) m(6)t(6)A37 methyltransferase TsaA